MVYVFQGIKMNRKIWTIFLVLGQFFIIFLVFGNGTTIATKVSTNNAIVGARANLTIIPGEYTKAPLGPAYIPSVLHLPANTWVTMTITNLDTATPLPSNLQMFDKVAGVQDNLITATPINPQDPNGSTGPTTTLSQVNPQDVAHTFSISKTGLNVPIPATSRVTFTFYTGNPGTYYWHCNDPCGTGTSGFGGAMETKGYMIGTIIVS